MRGIPSITVLVLAVVAAVVGFFCADLSGPEAATGLLGFLLLGAALNMRDAALNQTKALPNGAANTSTDGFNLELSDRGDFLARCELVVSVPALTTGELADGQTITFTVEHDTASGFGTVATLATLGVVTGAGGAGAAAVEYRYRFPVDVKSYVRVKATKAGASNASTKSMTTELVF